MTEVQKDYGKQPYVTNLEDLVIKNDSYRTVIWTGNHLQGIVMSIAENDEAGVEVHKNIDQFIRIEEGQGVCRMGPNKDEFDFERAIIKDDAIFIPGNMWHNIINTGGKPLKLYTIYSVPEYAEGTIHQTKEEASKNRLSE